MSLAILHVALEEQIRRQIRQADRASAALFLAGKRVHPIREEQQRIPLPLGVDDEHLGGLILGGGINLFPLGRDKPIERQHFIVDSQIDHPPFGGVEDEPSIPVKPTVGDPADSRGVPSAHDFGSGAAASDPAAALHRSSAPAEDSTGTMRAGSEFPSVPSGAEHPQVPAPLHDQVGGQPE